MRKTVLALCVLAVLFVAGGGVGFAIPSQGGPTGIVSVPIAQVLPLNELEAALTYQSIKLESMYQSHGAFELSLRDKLAAAQSGYGGGGGGFGGFGANPIFTDDSLGVYSLHVLGGVADRVEGWAQYSFVNGGGSTNVWGLGAKALVRPPDPSLLWGASISAGASYQSWIDVENVTKAYLVATAPLNAKRTASRAAPPLFGTVGLMYLKADGDAFVGSESGVLPFLGLQAFFNAQASAGIEYRWPGDMDAEGIWSLVFREQLSPQYSAEIGTTNASPAGTGLHNQGLFVRLGYHFLD